MSRHQLRNLALALAAVTVACTGGSDTTTSNGTTASSTGSGTATTGDAGTATADSTGAGPSGSGSGTDSDATTSSSTGSTGTSGTTDDTACAQGCAVIEMCEDDPFCVEECLNGQNVYDFLGSCGEDYRALYLCIAGLTCEEYTLYMEEEGEYPCKEEFTAIENPDGIQECLLDDVPPACIAYCETSASCGLVDGEIEECHAGCVVAVGQSGATGGAPCVAAYEALFACYGGLTCAELENEDGCEAEAQALGQACS